MTSLITTIGDASRWQRRVASFLMFAVTLVSASFSTTVSALAKPTIYAQHIGDAVDSSARSANLTQGVAPSQSTNAVSSGGGAIESAHFTPVASANAIKVRESPNSGFHVVSVIGDDCSGVLAPTHIGGNVYRSSADGLQFNCSRGGHFYALVDSEISSLLGLNPTNAITPEMPDRDGVDSSAFSTSVAGIRGSCASGLVPVLGVFRGNVRFPDDPHHRFTTSTTIYNEFIANGWDGEGVKFCVRG